MKFEVTQLSNDAYPEWDSFVASHPQGSFFHTTSWLGRFSRSLEVLVARDEAGVIAGGAAVYRSYRHGCIGLHSPPFTPWFGPLVRSSGAKRGSTEFEEYHRLVAAILEALPRAGHYDFRLPPGMVSVLPYHWAGFSSSVRYTFEVQPETAKSLPDMARRKKQAMNSARREVERGNLCVDTNGSFRELVDLSCRVAGLKGFRLNEKLLRRLHPEREKGDRWKIILIKDEKGAARAGILILLDASRIYGQVNGLDPEYRDAKGHASLLTFEACFRLAAESGRVFDFRGSMLLGVANHFAMLGGKQVPCIRLQKTRSPLTFSARAVAEWFAALGVR